MSSDHQRTIPQQPPTVEGTPTILAGLTDPDRVHALLPGATLGQYEILGELGRGGMGVVYKARQLGLDRVVALKMILGDPHPDLLDRFRAEAQMLARLQHPNIVQVYEVGEFLGRPYFSLEFVDGGTLGGLSAGAPQVPEQAARWVATLGRAIQAAHDHGVIHRDLKPGNVLVSAAGVLKVSDFGLAKRLEGDSAKTRTGVIVGTPAYMAPEQAEGTHPLTPAVDVWALGALLYDLLTGRPPFHAATPLDTVLKVITEEPVAPRTLRPELPRDLETVCLKCLEKDPARRYASAAELAADLDRFLAGEPVRARPVGPLGRLARWSRRNPGLAGLSAALLIALASLVVGSVSAAIWYEREKEDALRMAGKLDHALGEAEAARTEAVHKLEGSYLAQARARRWSGQPGQRYESLDALREAAGLARKLGSPPERLLELRNEAIAAAALPVDIRPAGHWPYVGDPAREAVAFDRDLAHFATHRGKGEVVVYRSHDGLEVGRMPALEGSGAVQLTFSPDGQSLAVNYIDITVPGTRLLENRVWDWRKARVLVRHPATTHTLGWLHWLPDGKRFASVSPHIDNLRIYSFPSGKEVACYRTGRGWQGWAAVGASRVAQVNGTQAVLRDLDTGLVAKQWTLPASANGIVTRTDGALLATIHHRVVMIWAEGEYAAPKLHFEAHEEAIRTAGFSPDGQLLMTTSWDATVRFWDPFTGRPLLTTPGTVGAVTFSADGRLVVTRPGHVDVGLLALPREGELSRCRPRRPVGNTTTALAWHPSGRFFASGGWDGVRLWGPSGGLEIGRLTSSRAMSVLFDPAGKRLFALESGRLLCWPIDADGDRVRFGEPRQATVSTHTDTGIHPRMSMDREGRRLAVADFRAGATHVFPGGDLDGRRLVLPLAETWDCAVSPDGRWVAGSNYGLSPPEGLHGMTVRVWDAESGKPAAERLHTRRSHLAFSPDGRWLAATDSDAYRFWEVGTWKPLDWTVPRGNDGLWNWGEMAFRPDGRVLAVTHTRREVRLIDLETRRPLATLASDDERSVRHLAFSPDGNRLAVARDGNLIHVWDLHALGRTLAGVGLADGWPATSPSFSSTSGPEIVVQGQ